MIPEENCFTTLFSKLIHTDVHALEVLPRYETRNDISQEHFNVFRNRFNETLVSASAKFQHVKIMSAASFTKNDLNRSRLHLNIYGKAKLIIMLFAST